MPGGRAIPSEEANLSIDFLVGFTIFMVAFIFVATMMSGLLINLQSKTIDYDAVAYRTGVVLVEDPGQPPIEDPGRYHNWAYIDKSIYRDDVLRLGLGYDKFYPGVLSPEKIRRFFQYAPGGSCTGDVFCYPDDYRSKLIFGDYPYRFNITLKTIGSPANSWHLGERYNVNSSYGYIRRDVAIREPGLMQINYTAPSGNSTTQVISLNFSEFYSRETPYQIDPLNEDLTIYLNYTGGAPAPQIVLAEWTKSTSPEKHTVPITSLNGNYSIQFNAGYFANDLYALDKFSLVNITLTYDQNLSISQYYSYTNPNVTTPYLVPGVLEVRIW